MRGFSIRPNGDFALTIIFEQEAGETLICNISKLCNLIYSELNQTALEVIPAYQSITVYFNQNSPSYSFSQYRTLSSRIKNIIEQFTYDSSLKSQGEVVTIPVCYDPKLGTDLDYVSEKTGLSFNQIVEQHSKTNYLVNMLGFLPGFFYLSGLSKALHCSRKAVPSLNVPAGAVGIGGTQTGVYPVSSPGGWQVIGQTPMRLFRPNFESPFIVKPLDKVKFKPISLEEFEKIQSKVLKENNDAIH